MATNTGSGSGSGTGSGSGSGTGGAKSQDQVEFITKTLQASTRMVQSMTGVIDLNTGHTFEPQEGSGAGSQRIRFNRPVFDQLRAVLNVRATAR